MPDLDDVKSLIERAIPGARVEVEDFAGGGGDHLTARVVSERFAGLSRLEQHRLVYAAVEAELGSGAIHALSIKTALPDQT